MYCVCYVCIVCVDWCHFVLRGRCEKGCLVCSLEPREMLRLSRWVPLMD